MPATIELTEDEKPDVIELNDWCFFTQPDFHAAIKYLHESVRYDAMLKLWIEKGKPPISEEDMQNEVVKFWDKIEKAEKAKN